MDSIARCRPLTQLHLILITRKHIDFPHHLYQILQHGDNDNNNTDKTLIVFRRLVVGRIGHSHCLAAVIVVFMAAAAAAVVYCVGSTIRAPLGA